MKQKKNNKKTDDKADDKQMTPEKMQELTDSLQEENDKLSEKLQRISADYANYQKRIPRQISESVEYEKKVIIKSLLPSLNNFDHALEAASTAEDIESVTKGVQMIFDHMLDALKAHGVNRVGALGQQFDPLLHEAMMQRAEPDKEDNIVLEEYQKGYTINGQMLQPCKVVVNKLPEETPEQNETPADQQEKNGQGDSQE